MHCHYRMQEQIIHLTPIWESTTLQLHNCVLLNAWGASSWIQQVSSLTSVSQDYWLDGLVASTAVSLALDLLYCSELWHSEVFNAPNYLRTTQWSTIHTAYPGRLMKVWVQRRLRRRRHGTCSPEEFPSPHKSSGKNQWPRLARAVMPFSVWAA